MKILFIFFLMIIVGCRPAADKHLSQIGDNKLISIIKTTTSIHPKDRIIQGELKLSSQQKSKIISVLKESEEKKVLYVCCAYYLRLDDGGTIGLILDNERKSVHAFDMGRNMNSLETHSKSVRTIRVIEKSNQAKEVYELVKSLCE